VSALFIKCLSKFTQDVIENCIFFIVIANCMFFVPKFQDMDMDDMWFQQEDATCHTAQETIQLLNESFPDRVISRFGNQI